MNIKEIEELIEKRTIDIKQRLPDNINFIFSWDCINSTVIDKSIVYVLWSKENYPNYASLIFSSRDAIQIHFNYYRIIEFSNHLGKISELFLPDEFFLDENKILMPFIHFLDNIIIHELLEYYCKKYGIELQKEYHNNLRKLVRYYQQNRKEKIAEEKIRNHFTENLISD